MTTKDRKNYILKLINDVILYFESLDNLNSDKLDKISFLKEILQYKDGKENQIVNLNSAVIQLNILNKYSSWKDDCKSNNNNSVYYDYFMNNMLLYLVLVFKNYGTFKAVSPVFINSDTVKFELFKRIQFKDFDYYKELCLNDGLSNSIVRRCNNISVSHDFKKMYILRDICIEEYSKFINDDDTKSYKRKIIGNIDKSLTNNYVKKITK